MPTKHVLIKGKVQGVFYRASAKEAARKLNVTGWIKNLANGNVEAKISATGVELDSFIKWCQAGPDKAQVSEVIVTDVPEEAFPDFRIVR